MSGPEGVLGGLRPDAIHIGTSTVSPGPSDELATLHAEVGRRYLAGPVVGRVPAAEAAQLVTFVAGDADAIETARAVITTYAPMMMVVGERQSQASTAKLSQRRVTRRLTTQILRRPWKRRITDDLDGGFGIQMFAHLAKNQAIHDLAHARAAADAGKKISE